MPWTKEWCARRKLRRELERMKAEAETATPEKPLGPILWLDSATRDAQEEALSAYYAETNPDMPRPAFIPSPPRVSMTEAAEIHKARLNRAADQAANGD